MAKSWTMTENQNTTSAAIEAEANQSDTKASRALADATSEFQNPMVAKGVNQHICRALIINMVFGFLATVCSRLEVDSAWACKMITTLWPLTVEKSATSAHSGPALPM
jgi:hypothetical protein